MSKTLALALVLLLALAARPSAGDEPERRIEGLERHDAELYHTLEGRKAAGRKTPIDERFRLSGLVEVELSLRDSRFYGGESRETASDLVVATVQLGLEAEVTEELSATLILDWEEGEDTAVQVDRATLDYERDGWVARLGRLDLPFGVFPSHLVSDPLTTDLGETKGTAVVGGYRHERFAVELFVFNGDAERRGDDDHLRDWGLGARWAAGELLEVGAGFLSDLAESNAELAPEYERRVSAWTAHAVVDWGFGDVLGEIVAALRPFDAADLDEDEDGSGDRPLAWNLEAAWELREDLELAARVAGSREFFEEPKTQYGACVSWSPWPSVSLSLEALRDRFDRRFGGGARRTDRLTAQVAAEF